MRTKRIDEAKECAYSKLEKHRYELDQLCELIRQAILYTPTAKVSTRSMTETR